MQREIVSLLVGHFRGENTRYQHLYNRSLKHCNEQYVGIMDFEALEKVTNPVEAVSEAKVVSPAILLV